MPFLGLAGTPQRVVDGSLVRRAAIYQGGRERMMAGNIISTEHTPMRVYDFKVVWFTQAEEDAVRAFYPRGVPTSFIDENQVPFAALIDFGETEFVKMLNADGSKTVYRRCAVHIEETVLV